MLNLTFIPFVYMGAGSVYFRYIFIPMGMVSIPAGAMCMYTYFHDLYTACMISNKKPEEIPVCAFFTHWSELLTSKNKLLPLPKFSPAGKIFTLMAHIFYQGNIWPQANCEMVTNNLTTVIEVKIYKI